MTSGKDSRLQDNFSYGEYGLESLENLISRYHNVMPALSRKSYGLFSRNSNTWIETHSINFGPPYYGRSTLQGLVQKKIHQIRDDGWKDSNSSAILAIDQGVGNYYHFLVNQLPFLVLAKRLYPEIDLIVLNECASFMLEHLKLFEINAHVISLRNQSICLSTCITSSQYLPKSNFARIDNLIQLASELRPIEVSDKFKPRFEKVYIERKISRNGSVARKVEPNEPFQAWLARNNFSIVYMEDLTVEEQIYIFQTSRVIAAVHGAALANIVFCKPNTTIIEIVHEAGSPEMFLTIARKKGFINYHRVACPGYLSDTQEQQLKHVFNNSSNNVLPLCCTDNLLSLLSSA